MSENETTTETPATPTTKESAAGNIIATIAAKVKDSNPEVQRRFIESQVDAEITSRVGLLDKAMQKRFQCMTELNKVNRADIETFNADGSTASATFSKDRLKAIKDGKEALAKVESAIEKAIAGDWSKVKELK